MSEKSAEGHIEIPFFRCMKRDDEVKGGQVGHIHMTGPQCTMSYEEDGKTIKVGEVNLDMFGMGAVVMIIDDETGEKVNYHVNSKDIWNMVNQAVNAQLKREEGYTDPDAAKWGQEAES